MTPDPYEEFAAFTRACRPRLLRAAFLICGDSQRATAHSDEVPLRVVLERALSRLTPKQRAVLVLRYFEDHTEARTAQVLGVTVGTVKSQTAVALRRLRDLAPELSDLVELRGASRAARPMAETGNQGGGQ